MRWKLKEIARQEERKGNRLWRGYGKLNINGQWEWDELNINGQWEWNEAAEVLKER